MLTKFKCVANETKDILTLQVYINASGRKLRGTEAYRAAQKTKQALAGQGASQAADSDSDSGPASGATQHKPRRKARRKKRKKGGRLAAFKARFKR